MSVERLRGPEPTIGCVVRGEVGVFDVITDAGVVRASLDGAMLGKVARDRDQMPQAGHWVTLRRWADERWTVTAVLAPRAATVIAFPQHRRR